MRQLLIPLEVQESHGTGRKCDPICTTLIHINPFRVDTIEPKVYVGGEFYTRVTVNGREFYTKIEWTDVILKLQCDPKVYAVLYGGSK